MPNNDVLTEKVCGEVIKKCGKYVNKKFRNFIALLVFMWNGYRVSILHGTLCYYKRAPSSWLQSGCALLGKGCSIHQSLTNIVLGLLQSHSVKWRVVSPISNGADDQLKVLLQNGWRKISSQVGNITCYISYYQQDGSSGARRREYSEIVYTTFVFTRPVALIDKKALNLTKLYQNCDCSKKLSACKSTPTTRNNCNNTNCSGEERN